MKRKITKELRSEMLSVQGEMVDHREEKDLTPSMKMMRENPYKTPPNNLTSKRNR